MIIKGYFCLFLHKNICCGYSLESLRGDSNEYPQHMFLWRYWWKLSFNYHQIPSLSAVLWSTCYTVCPDLLECLFKFLGSLLSLRYFLPLQLPVWIFQGGEGRKCENLTGKGRFTCTIWLGAVEQIRWGCLMIIKGRFSVILYKNICWGYSLESHLQGDLIEYSQHMFLWRNMENP